MPAGESEGRRPRGRFGIALRTGSAADLGRWPAIERHVSRIERRPSLFFLSYLVCLSLALFFRRGQGSGIRDRGSNSGVSLPGRLPILRGLPKFGFVFQKWSGIRGATVALACRADCLHCLLCLSLALFFKSGRGSGVRGRGAWGMGQVWLVHGGSRNRGCGFGGFRSGGASLCVGCVLYAIRAGFSRGMLKASRQRGTEAARYCGECGGGGGVGFGYLRGEMYNGRSRSNVQCSTLNGQDSVFHV